MTDLRTQLRAAIEAAPDPDAAARSVLEVVAEWWETNPESKHSARRET